jgi:hypothetical protein
MTPQTVQTRDARQDDRQQPLDLGRLVAPVLQLGLEFYSFGPRSQIVRDLFREQPDIFRGTNVADGTNLPSAKNVLLFEALEERARLKAA